MRKCGTGCEKVPKARDDGMQRDIVSRCFCK